MPVQNNSLSNHHEYGIKLMTPGSAIRLATDCAATGPGESVTDKKTDRLFSLPYKFGWVT